jgi:hypothetical protein
MFGAPEALALELPLNDHEAVPSRIGKLLLEAAV